MIGTTYLVIKADRSLRLAKRPRFAPDEVGVRLQIHFPDSWGTVVADLHIDLPDDPPTVDFVPRPELASVVELPSSSLVPRER